MIDKMIRILRSSTLYIAISALLLLMVIVSAEVITRTFFSYSFLFVDELSGYLLVFCIFFGAIYSFDSNGFVRVEVIYNKYPHKFVKTIDILLLLICLIFGVTLNYNILKLAMTSYIFNSTAPTFMEAPLYIPQLFMVVGLLLFNFYLLLIIIQKIFPSEKGGS